MSKVSDKPGLHPSISTVGGITVILVAAGFGFRGLDDYLNNSSVGTNGAISNRELTELSIQINAWQGRDVPLDDRLRAATDADALLNRVYVRPGGDAVTLFVASGSQPRQMAPHRPEVCYPSAGWDLASESEATISSGNLQVPVRVLHFTRGTFGEREMIVLHFYFVEGHYSRNVQELRFRHWEIGELTQIQLAMATSVWKDAVAAQRVLLEFGTEVLPRLNALLVGAQ
jgi:EpsI family protein